MMVSNSTNINKTKQTTISELSPHVIEHKKRPYDQGFQYFSSVPVLHYLQVVLFIFKTFEKLS
jgi:hypothetical protein